MADEVDEVIVVERRWVVVRTLHRRLSFWLAVALVVVTLLWLSALAHHQRCRIDPVVDRPPVVIVVHPPAPPVAVPPAVPVVAPPVVHRAPPRHIVHRVHRIVHHAKRHHCCCR